MSDVQCFVFVHSLVIVTVFIGILLSLIWRGYTTNIQISPKLSVILGSVAGGIGVAHYSLELKDVLNHGPFVAEVLRVVAVAGLDPSRRHQAWCIMFQTIAASITVCVLHMDFGGIAGMGKSQDLRKLAAYGVLAMSVLHSMVRTAKHQKIVLVLPVALALVMGCLDLSTILEKHVAKVASEFAVVFHLCICAFGVLSGASVCVVPLLIIAQLLLKVHDPHGRLFRSVG